MAALSECPAKGSDGEGGRARGGLPSGGAGESKRT